MTTVHIENTVRDYEAWQEAFDKFERFRAENGVRSYRISRRAADPEQVTVDLELRLTGRRPRRSCRCSQQIWSTPQSREQLVAHTAPALHGGRPRPRPRAER